jgi:RHS repeat-associated protein
VHPRRALQTLGSPNLARSGDITFRYDARGNLRVARQVSSQWTQVVHDGGGRPLSELALVGGAYRKVRDYVWLDGLLTPRALTNATGQLVWGTYQRPNGEVLEKTVPDVTGRTVVTNLRLPGQYDEKLFQAAGINMHGPYYNWHRWYLPGVGRYLELDPVSMAGEAKEASWTPDWYTYAMGNSLVYTDRMGLDIDVCFYADAAWGLGHVGFGPGRSRQTSGFYPANSWDPFRDWGEARPDQQKKQQCKTLPSPPEKDQCMENCRAGRAAKPAPTISSTETAPASCGSA